MRSALFYCISIVLLAACWKSPISLAVAAETASRLTNEQLIKQLSHGSLNVRDHAATTLGDRGRSALTAIEEAIPLTDGEAAFRLTRLAAAITLAETSRQTAPGLVTLSLDDKPLKEIVRQITIQTGNQILVPDTAASFCLTCNQLPFWEAIEKLADTIEGNIILDDQPPGLSLAPALSTVQPRLPTTTTELIRVAVLRVDQLGTAGERGFRLILRVAWEPRLAPVIIRLSLASIVAESEAGATIRQPKRQGVVEPVIIKNRCWVDLPLVLSPPSTGISQLASLRGTIEMWLPGFDHHFRLPLLRPAAKPSVSSSQLGSMAVELDAWWPTVTPAGQDLTVRATAKLAESSEACDSHRGWLADRVPKLLPSSGPALTATAHRVVGHSDRGLTVETSFTPPLPSSVDGLKMSWRLPVGVFRLPADFWLENIPLDNRTNSDQ